MVSVLKKHIFIFKDLEAEGLMVSKFSPSTSFFSIYSPRTEGNKTSSDYYPQSYTYKKENAGQIRVDLLSEICLYHVEFKCLLQTSFNSVLGTPQFLEHIWCALRAYLPAQLNPKGSQLACSGTAKQHKSQRVIQFINAFLIQTKIFMYTHCSALHQTNWFQLPSDDLF